MDPPNAKRIKSCLESGNSGNSYRYMFTTSQTWRVPPGVKSALVSMAGGGGSGSGWRMVNTIFTGHSGGYIFSQPVNLTPNEDLQIIIGTGGQGKTPVNTGVVASVGPPYFIYTNPPSDDGLGGYPGTASKIISPSLGTLVECAGGSGTSFSGVDTFGGSLVAGNLAGGTTGSGTPIFPSPSRKAAGTYANDNGPGSCGVSNYGIGNPGVQLFSSGGPISSGSYVGGTTPFGYGSGGSVYVSGCYVTPTIIGTCIYPGNGRDGIVYIDVWQ